MTKLHDEALEGNLESFTKEYESIPKDEESQKSARWGIDDKNLSIPLQYAAANINDTEVYKKALAMYPEEEQYDAVTQRVQAGDESALTYAAQHQDIKGVKDTLNIFKDLDSNEINDLFNEHDVYKSAAKNNDPEVLLAIIDFIPEKQRNDIIVDNNLLQTLASSSIEFDKYKSILEGMPADQLETAILRTNEDGYNVLHSAAKNDDLRFFKETFNKLPDERKEAAINAQDQTHNRRTAVEHASSENAGAILAELQDANIRLVVTMPRGIIDTNDENSILQYNNDPQLVDSYTQRTNEIKRDVYKDMISHSGTELGPAADAVAEFLSKDGLDGDIKSREFTTQLKHSNAKHKDELVHKQKELAYKEAIESSGQAFASAAEPLSKMLTDKGLEEGEIDSKEFQEEIQKNNSIKKNEAKKWADEGLKKHFKNPESEPKAREL